MKAMRVGDTMNRLTAVRLFKGVLRSLPFMVDGPPEYPLTAMELQAKFPTIYASALGVNSAETARVSETDVQIEISGTPARVTKKGYGDDGAPRRGWENLPRRAFGDLIRSAEQLQRSDTVPGLVIYDQPRRAAQFADAPTGQQLPALPPPQQHPALPPPQQHLPALPSTDVVPHNGRQAQINS